MVEESSERVVSAGRSKTLLQLAPGVWSLGTYLGFSPESGTCTVDMSLNEYVLVPHAVRRAPSGETLLKVVKPPKVYC